MGQRVPSGQVTNVLKSFDAWLTLLIRKHMSDMTIQIYNQNWYIVETHSIPDKKKLRYYGLTKIRLQRQIS